MHYNLHKTFSTPHGGGGPGSGPVGVRAELADYLPGPRVRRTAVDGQTTYEQFQPQHSVGRLHSFHGNFGMHVRAYCYIRMHGAAGLRQVSEDAVLNANYLLANLRDRFDLPYDRTCMHEFVLSGNRQKQNGVRTLDIAKRLLDFGVHPPTTYFPLVVSEALMIEPTETESKESLDNFIAALRQIADEAETIPEFVTAAPHTTEYKRLDEVGANRNLNLRWKPTEQPVAEAVAAD
ncbi:MAG: glycine dehydrogenase subunit 2, partial [Thermomicrobiales bacterium]|nr:glycine dehydrogenase subunit 2 [Thermomicrobiales bacterium]